jgi:hypothetical protein
MFLGYNVTDFLRLQYVVRVMLFHMINALCFYLSTFRSMCAVPNMVIIIIIIIIIYHHDRDDDDNDHHHHLGCHTI